MASVGPGHFVVVVLHIGGSKASDIQPFYSVSLALVKLGFLPVQYCLTRSLLMLLFVSYFKETGLTLTVDDSTMLNDAPVRVALNEGQRQLVYFFSAYVPVPYVIANLRTHAKLEQLVTA
jgi:hypothetical protein